MEYSIFIKRSDWERWVEHFGAATEERMAFGYCGASTTANETQFLVQQIDLPHPAEYRHQGLTGVSLKAEHVLPRVRRAREHAALVDGHSHPFTSRPSPSATDNAGAEVQFRVIRHLAPGTALIRLIFGQAKAVWAEVSPLGELRWTPVSRIVVMGSEDRREEVPVNAESNGEGRRLGAHEARTAVVLGEEATRIVRALRALVIGGGGLGSAVLAQIKGYVDDITIVDPDTVEAHNAPRLYQYAAGDEGRFKAEVEAREIRRAFASGRVRAVCERFPDRTSLEAFKEADVVFCCPDHNAVRYRAAQLAVRFFKPLPRQAAGAGRRVSRL